MSGAGEAGSVAVATAEESPADAARNQSPIYTIEELANELRQAEIITGLIQWTYDPVTNEGIDKRHDYAIVVSQDCDLLWDYTAAHENKDADLNGVLLFEVEPLTKAITDAAAKGVKGSDIWKRRRQNNDERYHVLEAIPSERDQSHHGLGALIVDFKKYFTMPATEIYRQIADPDIAAKRRCRLEMPYREHFVSRAAFYMQRVSLLLPHRV